jgi:pimeloyl-ACP methyl ester carboxylesterase
MWYGAWCFERVVSLLGGAGIQATAVELTHSGELARDVNAVRAVLASSDDPVIVLGHSYGGVVITEAAAEHDHVEHLVYLAAFMPDENETLPMLVTSVDDQLLRPGQGLLLRQDGTAAIDPAQAADLLFGDCETSDALAAIPRLSPEHITGSPRPPAAVAWRDTPSTYVRCTADRALSQTLQARFAERASRSLQWPTSHSPFISQPQMVSDLLTDLHRAHG